MIINSQFKPAPGLSGAHIQTLLPSLLRSGCRDDFRKQTIELDDGDFLDLCWTNTPHDGKPIVIVFHGLEGSICSPYAQGIMAQIRHNNWTGLLMHLRGCSGRPNRLSRSYHSGDTSDAKYLLNWLSSHYPDSALSAIGYSLGGNMLLKLQAELADHSPLKATISVCAPLVLDECAAKLNRGFSKFYQHHLLGRLKRNLRHKYTQHDFKQLINLGKQDIKQLNNFRLFDDRVTAPLHGFKGVNDYYSVSSARQYLSKITKPALMIHSLDDPFMSKSVIPEASELSATTVLEISRYGGHVGFISGHMFKPVFWLEQRISEYLDEFI